MSEQMMSRRELLAGGAAAAPLLSLASLAEAQAPPSAGNDPWRGLRVGVASYTLRKLPLDDAIKAIQRVDLHYVSIKDAHLSLKSTTDERRAVAAKFKAAGITPLSCGNITMDNSEANVRAAFEYARDAGIPTIVCSPDPNSMPLLDRMVKEFDIRIAIHNHGPEDKKYPSPYDAMKLVEAYDRRLGLCIDVGHTARAGVDPAESIVKCKDRLYDIHLKDISALGNRNTPIESGRGILNQMAILQALVQIKFGGHVGFEYEKDADDPVPGLAESVGFTRGLMAAMRHR